MASFLYITLNWITNGVCNKTRLAQNFNIDNFNLDFFTEDILLGSQCRFKLKPNLKLT